MLSSAMMQPGGTSVQHMQQQQRGSMKVSSNHSGIELVNGECVLAVRMAFSPAYCAVQYHYFIQWHNFNLTAVHFVVM